MTKKTIRATSLDDSSGEQSSRRDRGIGFGMLSRPRGTLTPKTMPVHPIRRFSQSIKRLRQAISKADFLAPRITTVDISERTIRIVEIKGDSVTRWAAFPISTDGTLNPDTLKATIQEFGFKPGKAYVCRSGLYSLARLLKPSEFTRTQMTKDFALQSLKEVAPINESTNFVSWSYLSQVDGEMALVLSIPMEVTNAEIQLLKQIGFPVKSLELRFMSLSRISSGDVAVVLNVEPNEVGLVISTNGTPTVFRNIGWQYDSMQRSARTRFLANLVSTSLELFQAKEHQVENLQPSLWITGELAIDPELKADLQASLPLAVGSPPDILTAPGDFPASQYAANLGLAYKDNSIRKMLPANLKLNPLRMVNMLPSRYRERKVTTTQIVKGIAVIAAITLAAVGYLFTVQAMDDTLEVESRYTSLNNLLNQRQLQIQNLEPIKAQVNEFAIISNSDSHISATIATISEIAAALSIDIQEISIRENSCILTCQAESYLLFQAFVEEISLTEQFANIEAPPQGFPFTTGGQIRFDVTSP